MPIVIGMAREHGASPYVGEGDNVWPGVHRRDAARLYALALERAADFAIYQAVEEDGGVPFRDLAIVIGKHLSVPIESISGDEIEAHFGWFARFAQIHAPASSATTRTALGWKAREPGLLAEVDSVTYFPA